MRRPFILSVLLALILVLLCSSASAQDLLPPEAAALFQSAAPAQRISLWDQCGNTAAAVLTDGQTQTLCVAEKQKETWSLAVCNPAALPEDTPVTSLLLDTDDTLFWSYQPCGTTTVNYHASSASGQWRIISIIRRESYDNGSSNESHTWYEEGRLNYSTYYCDENDNVLSYRPYTPVPAMWLDEQMPLSVFDDASFPYPNDSYTHSWLSEEATALAAAELFPDDTFLGGCAEKDHLAFFLQTDDGEHIIAGCLFDPAEGWRICRSTPLPEGTVYGCENFSSSLAMGDLLVNIGPVDELTCGVTFIYNIRDMASGESMFRLGKNWITGESPNGYDNCFGDHPWADITAVDWNTLPHSLEEALSVMDASHWAVVNNPNPADRLHLRTEPNRSAQSLGKYYNGTPVRILDTKNDWVQVDIFGITGWMMKAYLAMGSAGHEVEAVFPSRVAAENYQYHYVFAQPTTRQPIASYEGLQQGLLVLGIVGDEWYHVWFPDDDLTGYVPQDDWKEGNG